MGSKKTRKKVSDIDLIAAYKKTNSIWKAAEILGICGQSVHERLKKLKIKLNNNPFSDKERLMLVAEYSKHRDDGRLIDLAEKMGRTKQFLCRKAKALGLTDRKKPYKIGKRDYVHKTGKESSRWLGGVTKNNLAVFDTYAPKIMFVDEVRRSQSNQILLEVRCAYCGKWFIPTMDEASRRGQSLAKGQDSRLYCSDKCREECPIYRKIKYPSGFRQATSREVVPLLRQIVFCRDEWKCQRCGATESLHCHHILSYSKNRILANDPDNCITLCKKCHKEVHKKTGCKGADFKCKKQ